MSDNIDKWQVYDSLMSEVRRLENNGKIRDACILFRLIGKLDNDEFEQLASDIKKIYDEDDILNWVADFRSYTAWMERGNQTDIDEDGRGYAIYITLILCPEPTLRYLIGEDMDEEYPDEDGKKLAIRLIKLHNKYA